MVSIVNYNTSPTMSTEALKSKNSFYKPRTWWAVTQKLEPLIEMFRINKKALLYAGNITSYFTKNFTLTL